MKESSDSRPKRGHSQQDTRQVNRHSTAQHDMLLSLPKSSMLATLQKEEKRNPPNHHQCPAGPDRRSRPPLTPPRLTQHDSINCRKAGFLRSVVTSFSNTHWQQHSITIPSYCITMVKVGVTTFPIRFYLPESSYCCTAVVHDKLASPI